MRYSSPPLVPNFDVTVYMVLDDFGDIGRSYVEVDENNAGRRAVIRRIVDGQYNNPQRIVAFNTAEGWSRDVSEEIAQEIKEWAETKSEALSTSARNFVEYHLGVSLAFMEAWQ